MRTNPAWLAYLLVGAAYTIFVFWFSIARDEVRVLSRRNAKPRFTIVVVHLLFLAVIFSSMPLIPWVEASLPDWQTTVYARGFSVFRGVLLLAALALRTIERRLIYADSGTAPS
jgi:NADH:ubiquinone oxidoreductase subunit 6 (subunit J)